MGAQGRGIAALMLVSAVLAAAPAQGKVFQASEVIREVNDRPLGMVGFTWGIRWPYELVGLGPWANIHLENILNLRLSYLYGFGLGEAGADKYGTQFLEFFAGFPFYNWNSTTRGDVALNQSHVGDYIITEYITVDIPSRESLIAEVGLMMGEGFFKVKLDTDGDGAYDDGTLKRSPFVLQLEAGLRYIYWWDVVLIDDSWIQNHSEFYIHALFGPFNTPDDKGLLQFEGDLLFEDEGDKEHAIRWVGVKAGLSMVMWANGAATIDFELGYLPGAGTVWLAFGNTFPWWF